MKKLPGNRCFNTLKSHGTSRGTVPREGVMYRSFYLYPLKSGIYCAEILNTETGARIASKSTGSRKRDEAVLKVGEWLRTGIPTGRARKPRSVGAVSGLGNILRVIKNTLDLDGDGAMEIVMALKKRALIDIPVVKSGPGNVSLIGFLEEFWDYEKSPYIREKLAHGQSIGQRHCSERRSRVKTYWKPYFSDRSLNSITRADLKSFSLSLAEKRQSVDTTTQKKGRGGKIRVEKLSPASINQILITGTTALSWAFREDFIPTDPSEGLVRFAGKSKKRGVLTPAEAVAVFSVAWKDKRAYAGNLLSITTGLRSGEVLALRESDISLTEDVLYIKHSWSSLDGLKSPKNGETRKVPLLPEVRAKLLDLLSENLHKKEQDASENPDKEKQDFFVFYGSLKDKPTDNKLLIDGLKEACREVGNNPNGWVTDPSAAEGDGSLWMVRGEKNARGQLQGEWVTPVKVAEKDLLSVLNTIPAAAKGDHIEIRYRRCIQGPTRLW